MARLALVSVFAARVLGQPGESVIEFDIGPMGPGPMGPGAAMDGPPPELLKMMGFDVGPPSIHAASRPGSKSAQIGTKSISNGREEDLDRALRGMFGGPDPRDQDGPQGALVIEGPDGEQVVLDAPPQMMQGPRSRMPVDAFQNLFPGPLAFAGPADMDHADVIGFGGPDPMVMDMLQDMSQAFQE